jgi:autotransporter-associated beta strand protein
LPQFRTGVWFSQSVKRFLRTIAFAILFHASVALPLQAQTTFYWDVDNGTWSTSAAKWSLNSSGGSDRAWANGGNYANFGTAETFTTVDVTVSDVDAAQITFETGHFSIKDSTITLDNYNSTGYCLVSAYNGDGTFANFATLLAGSGVGLEVGGDGTAGIELSKANTYSGGTKVDSGGEVTVTGSSSIPSGALILGSSTNSYAIIKCTPLGEISISTTVSIGNGVLIGGNVNFCNGEGGNLTFTGGVTLGANVTLEVHVLTTTFNCVVSGRYPLNLGGPYPGGMILSGPNTYSGGTTINIGTLQVDSAENAGTSGPLGYSGTISFGGGTLQFSSANSYDYSGRFSTATGQAYNIDVNGEPVTFATALTSSSGTLTLRDSGTGGKLTLTADNTFTGATTINSGTLALSNSGSINNSPTIFIAAGGTFDVSAFTSYTLSSGTTLSASGAGTTIGSTAATIKGGATVSLGSQLISLTYTPTTFNGDTNHPALYISQGTLSLNDNIITVSNASGTALGAGTNRLIQQASGSITTSGSYLVSVTGSGLVSGSTASIQVSGGNVDLVVVPAPPVIQTATQSGSSFSFTWSTISNQTYQIQGTASLAPANWTNIGGTNSATNFTVTTSEPIGANSQQFYRIVLLP